MKKNKMMRMASALLVATLLSTSVIAGTFAKYTTTASGSDTARVAKFGVEITANGSTFATEYAKKDSTDENSVSVKAQATASTDGSSKTDNVVAPGTSGNMAKMTLKGTPEVAVKVSYNGNFTIDDNWKVKTADSDEGTFYCPLKITVKATSNGANSTTELLGTNYSSKDEFVKAVNSAINSYSQEYEPGTDLSQKGEDSLSVSWAWAYEAGETSSQASGLAQSDAYDTALGDATTPATVTLEVTTTVTQVD